MPRNTISIKKNKDIIAPLSLDSIMEGEIIKKSRSAVFVDLGIFGTGVIHQKELLTAKGALKNLKIGDKIFIKVIDLENEEGYKELSLKGAEEEISWEKLKEKKEKEEILEIKITGANKGGLLAEVAGIMAFLPVSQLSPENYPKVEDGDSQKIFRELQKFIGKTLKVKILDLSSRQNKLILSEKAKNLEGLYEILKEYKIGDVVEGKITGLAEFGAFIKFPLTQPSTSNTNIEGLIHISELDWQIIEDPAEIVKVDQIIKVQIIDIKNDQVFLSLKRLKKNPWLEIEKKYKKGDEVKGKVAKLSPFGAFIQINPKVRGLCHISEFATKSEMEESLKIGENYNFQILAIDPLKYRINLKLIKS